jgi:hypothetical protein
MSKPTPEPMAVKGRPLTCVVCGGVGFTRRSVTMITSGAANTGFNKVADAVTCGACGFIHHFVAGVVEPVRDAAGE